MGTSSTVNSLSSLALKAMRSSVALLFLAAAAISSSVHFAHCSSDSKAQFTAAEAQVLRVFANAILDEMEENENFVLMPGTSQQQQPFIGGAPSYKRVPAKRNSGLLNSLLGLPKNILKSGRK